MPKDICIVHIEDEFYQMQNLASRMKQYAEQFWASRSKAGSSLHVKLVRTHMGQNNGNAWVVYDVQSQVPSLQKLRYVFVAGPGIPDGVIKHISEGAHFIIDVLRSRPNSPGLYSTADISIAAARTVGASLADITIYTACQGVDRNKLQKDYLGVRIIEKAKSGELALFISRIVVAGLRGVGLDE